MRDLLQYCVQKMELPIAQNENGEWLCGHDYFVFMLRCRGIEIPVMIQRYNELLINLATVRALDDLNKPEVKKFLHNIKHLRNRVIPGIASEEDEDGNVKDVAILRGEFEADQGSPYKNQIRLATAILSIKQQLNELPPEFLTPLDS